MFNSEPNGLEGIGTIKDDVEQAIVSDIDPSEMS